MFDRLRTPAEQRMMDDQERVVHDLRVQVAFVVNNVNFRFDHRQITVTEDATPQESRLYKAEASHFAVDGRVFSFTLTYPPNVQLSKLIAGLKKTSARALRSDRRTSRSLTSAGRSVWIPSHRLISGNGLQPEA